jgi:hypothetical protein
MLLLIQVLFERGQRLGAQPVPAPLPFGPYANQPRLAEHAKMLGDSGLRQSQMLHEFANGSLALP